jgi:hypothetical protein
MGIINLNFKQLFIVENFYSPEDFNFVLTSSMLNPYVGTYQPRDSFYYRKEDAYSCHETKDFSEEDIVFNKFCKTFQEKTSFKIQKISTRFRKIYSSEIENVLKYGMPSHQDLVKDTVNIAGIVYINTSGLEDGTSFFSSKNQIEPDIIIGSVPNRCIFYDPSIWHRPLQDKKTNMRVIQPFFLKISYE